MDWLTQMDSWFQIGVFALVCSTVLAVILIIIMAIRKGIKLKNIEVGNSNDRYLTGAETIQLLHKNNAVLSEKFCIIHSKRGKDQKEYVKQKIDYIKDLMIRCYRKILAEQDIEISRKHDLQKYYKAVAFIMLESQKLECEKYFGNINGSLKDVSISEISNPESDLNKEILKQAEWMTRKGSEIISEWYVETPEVSRGSLYKRNLEIVEEVKNNIVDALLRGHKIHIQYDKKIESLDKELEEYADALLQKSPV